MSFKASSTLNFIRRNFRHAPQEVKERLYLSNTRPILEYTCIVWDPHTQNLIDYLESIQNSAARFLTHNYQFPTSITQIKKSLGWPNLSFHRTRFRICFPRDVYLQRNTVTRNLYLIPPNYVSTRRDHQFKIREVAARTSIFMNSFFPRSIKHWNHLPQHVMGMISDDKFFELLTQHLRSE